MTFLGARSTAQPAVVLAGVPYDATSSFRSGSRQAPAAIRWASQSIETYSPILRRDLTDVVYADVGDVDVAGLRPDQMLNAVRAFVGQMVPASIPFLLGGEHTVALGAVQALYGTHSDLAVVQVDAHTDLRDEYEGQRLSHATVTRRILDALSPQSLVQLGTRAGTREEFELASQLRHSAARIDIPGPIWAWLEQRPTYVSIDIDAIDPADAPGTGNQEPEGIPARDLLAFVRRLGSLQVVGLDVVEVSPPYDPSGRTAVLAATIVREAILALKGIA
ncbi:MAG TPA: agmatinase [bacterium]|nr:agmatinase [bacterium]